MTTLDRLQIRGIRSFGVNDDNSGHIKFDSPLTLILGQNGCGKTTIIESLKYACSGDQPPNSRSGSSGGSGFVHDPKMLKATEVSAQVKLRINDINGKKATVVRSMKNTQKLKKVEFKSSDSTITCVNSFGKTETISSRCVDTVKYMCYLLGVSKPILNYVIFCHQEENCWPMEEGKKVKERFDEIFDSVKYNKCLENIRKIRKQKVQGIAILKKEAESLQVYKSEAEEKSKKLSDNEVRLTATDDTIAACITEISVIDRKLDAVKEKEINIANLIAEKRGNTIKLEELQKSIKEVLTNLHNVEFQGTDEELEKEIQSFNSDFRQKEEELERLEKEFDKLTGAEKHLQSQVNKEQNNLGGLKRDLETNKDLIQHRNDLINKLAFDLKISEMESPYSDTQVDSVIQNIEKKLREMKRYIESIKNENNNKEKELQNIIDDLREEKAKLEQTKKAKTEQLSETKSEIERLKTEIAEVSQSTKNIAVLDNKLKRINKELEEQSSSVNIDDIDKQIKNLQKNRDKMDEELGEINKEVDDLIEVNKIQNSLDSCLDRKVASEDEIKRLMSKNEDTFKHLLENVPEKNISQHLDMCLSRLGDRIRTSQKEINDKQQELTRLESKQQHLEDKLRTSNQTLSSHIQEMEEVCGNEDYGKLLASVENKLKMKQDEGGKLKGSNYIYREYIKKLQQPQPCCPLCKRNFEEEDNAIQLAYELEEKLKSIPSTLSSITEDQGMLSSKLSRLQQLKPVSDRITSLKNTEIPTISEELSSIKTKVIKIKEELTNLENDLLTGSQSDEQLARSVQSDAIAIDQKQTELQNLQREIDELQNKLPVTGKTLQQVKNQRDQLQFELENVRKKIDSYQAKKLAYSNCMNKLEQEKNEIVKQQLKVQTGKQQEKQLFDKQNELKELKNVLTKAIESASTEILPIQQKLEQAIRNKEETCKKHSSLVDEENSKSVNFEQKSEEIHKLQSKLREFERRGISNKVEETERNISQMKRDLDGFAEQRKSLQSKKDTVKADKSNQGVRQRNLFDNKKLREKRREEVKLERILKDMDDKLGVLDYKLIKEERLVLQKEFDAAYSKVEETVCKDMGTYYVALEWALRHFHAQRMKTINSIIKEYWHKIYRGKDIDHIEIKCDDETVTTSADKRRNYNYRVVLVRGKTELDMRGRCSAGQKMLASIIIRMALAETFSNNCGIMTLDEPTTNLDRDNIESLSRALADIVSSQKRRKKFQLIVITHDEDFLLRLTSVDKVEKYWRVTKTDEGMSKIKDYEV
ncbi:DNA repair protein rad50 isoform X2 [Lycorma delicatula]|uniref:DNA repair protein rad50 isoform X2 n=1 Tax=Lycorma delicatula TaxID=130591 RepID=UPI003F5119EF